MKKISLLLIFIGLSTVSFAQKVEISPNEIFIETKNYADIDFAAIENQMALITKKKVKLTVKQTVPCNNECGYSIHLISFTGKPKSVLKDMKKYCAKKVKMA